MKIKVDIMKCLKYLRLSFDKKLGKKYELEMITEYVFDNYFTLKRKRI